MIKLGLALGSGGARGLAHEGILAVLEEEGLRPHCISGTSMGAIIGALYCEVGDIAEVARRLAIYTEDAEFKSCWEPFVEDDEMETRGRLTEFRRAIQRRILSFKTFTTPAQQRAEQLLEPLRRLFETESIEDLQLPFACVAMDLISGEPRVFDRGFLVSAIYASGAIPGVFPPLPLGGQLLIDGGGPYRVPVSLARGLGAEFVLAIDIPTFAPARDEFKTGLDVMMRSDTIARQRLNHIVLKEADLVVTPEVGDFHWANFGAADKIREAGAESMRAALPELRAGLARHESLSFRIKRRIVGLCGAGDDPSLAPRNWSRG